MRKLGAIVLFLGIVLATIGGFAGCGSLFTWNGKHPIAVYEMELGKPLMQKFDVVHGRRYVAGVQVLFDRKDLPFENGEIIVSARMPLVAQLSDGHGGQVAQTTGWLDPNEPPTFLHGRGVRTGDLAAERLVGPWTAVRNETATVYVRLDEDPAGSRVASVRVVLYDDRTPTGIILGLVAQGSGILAIVVGIGMLLLGWFRASRKRRDGISSLRVV
jgi:hypothetical protein